MARRGVHDAGALIERDVIGENAGHLNGQERDAEISAFEIAAFQRAATLRLASMPQSACSAADPIRREQQRAFFRFDHDVFKVRMKRQRAIVRQRPGSGRPDHGA